MFTGIIEDTGTLVGVSPFGQGRRLRIRTAIPLAEVKIGDSIAVNGACLTAERFDGDVFEVVAGAETLEKTALGHAEEGDRVHLERALKLGDRLDGHLVQGHVDGVGRVIDNHEADESWVLWLDVGDALARFVAPKGSICLDGVSLTVNEVRGTHCRINIIPHTAQVTRMAGLVPGDPINIEVDVLARYVDRILAVGRDADSDGLTLDHLQKNGFA